MKAGKKVAAAKPAKKAAAKPAAKKKLMIRRLNMRRIKIAVNLTLNNERRLEALEKKNNKRVAKALKNDDNLDDLLLTIDDQHTLNDDEEQRRLVNETIKQTMEEMNATKAKAKADKKLNKAILKKERRTADEQPKEEEKKAEEPKKEEEKKSEKRQLDDGVKSTSDDSKKEETAKTDDKKKDSDKKTEEKTDDSRKLDEAKEEKKDESKEEKKDESKEEKKDDSKEEKKDDSKEEKKDDTKKGEESKERRAATKTVVRKVVRKVVRRVVRRKVSSKKTVVKGGKTVTTVTKRVVKKRHTELRAPKRDTQTWSFVFPEIDSYIGNPGKLMLFEFNLRSTKLPDVLAVIIHLKDSAGKSSTLKKFVQGKDFEPIKQKDESTVYILPMKAKLAAEPSLKLHLSIKPELESHKEFSFYSVSDFKYEWGQLPNAEEDKEVKKGVTKKVVADAEEADKEEGKTVQAENKYDNAGEDKTSSQITEMKGASMQDLKDTIFKLTMIKVLPKGTQEEIKKANLKMGQALKRCNNVNGADTCEVVWGTMAVLKCSKGYFKMGCCQCVVNCPGKDFIDKGFYCKKAGSYNTGIYESMNNCVIKNPENPDTCVPYGVDSYVERCKNGFRRHGKSTCLKACPIGWADEGMSCIKPGGVKPAIPFPWMPGDNKIDEILKAKANKK